MKEYEVTFIEQAKRTILVKAECKEDAESIALDKTFKSEEIIEEEFQGNVIITHTEET